MPDRVPAASMGMYHFLLLAAVSIHWRPAMRQQAAVYGIDLLLLMDGTLCPLSSCSLGSARVSCAHGNARISRDLH